MNVKLNACAVGLTAAGIIGLPDRAECEEQPTSVLTALSSTTIGGYVSASAWWTPGTGNANPPTFLYNGAPESLKADGFNLDVVKLSIERPFDEDSFSASYKLDALFGNL